MLRPSAKAEAELAHLKQFLAGIEKKLGNEKFVANAPEAVVALERKKKSDAEAKIQSLQARLADLAKGWSDSPRLCGSYERLLQSLLLLWWMKVG